MKLISPDYDVRGQVPVRFLIVTLPQFMLVVEQSQNISTNKEDSMTNCTGAAYRGRKSAAFHYFLSTPRSGS